MENPSITCPNCSVNCIPSDRFCAECGSKLSVHAARLPGSCACGSTEFEAEGYCVSCGTKQRLDRGQLDDDVVGPGFAAVTDTGLTHTRNDDAFALAGPASGGPGSVIVVCDGVSNSQNPDIASPPSAKAARDRLATAVATGEDIRVAMRDAIRLAHEQTCSVPFDRNDELDPPAATIIAAVVQSSARPGFVTVTTGWLGDSRLYWLSKAGGRLLTKDHSWMNEVIEAG